MKKKFTKSIISLISCIVILIVIFGNYGPPRGFIFAQNNDTLMIPQDYYKYQNEVYQVNQRKINRLGSMKTSFSAGAIGTSEMYFKSTDSFNGKSGDLKYFITLNNLYIKEKAKLNGAAYAIDNDVPFIIKNDIKEPLPFYLNLELYRQKASDEMNTIVMFPISKFTYGVSMIILGVLIFMVVFCIVGVFLGGLWKLIENIAKGDAFSEDNVLLLRNISYVSFAVPILAILINIVIWFFMQMVYPNGFGLDPHTYFFNAKVMLIGVFFFALYRAFKKGLTLQQENELTV